MFVLLYCTIPTDDTRNPRTLPACSFGKTICSATRNVCHGPLPPPPRQNYLRFSGFGMRAPSLGLPPVAPQLVPLHALCVSNYRFRETGVFPKITLPRAPGSSGVLSTTCLTIVLPAPHLLPPPLPPPSSRHSQSYRPGGRC